MDHFEIYAGLQNYLVMLQENDASDLILKYILKYKLLQNEKLMLLTMKLLASFVYSFPKFLDDIILILKKIPKFNLNLNIIDVDIDDIYTSQEIIQRLQILYYLLFKSNQITKFSYVKIVEKINSIYNELFEDYGMYFPPFSFITMPDDKNYLYKSIYYDDVYLLQETIELNNIDIDQEFLFPNFEIYDTFSKPTLLEYSAFYGSICCFKYLLMKANNISFEKLIEFSIVGGNFDIIHITENAYHDTHFSNGQKLLYLAILYMKNELIEYILYNYDAKINGECYIKCINASNYNGLVILKDLENSASINDYGEYGLTPIIDAVFEGYADFFIYFLSLSEVDYKKVSRDGSNILYYAATAYREEIMDYLIKNKLIKPFDKGHNKVFCWWKAFEMFLHYQNIEDQEMKKCKWIKIDVNEISDDKDYMIYKRFYNKKYKKRDELIKKKRKKFIKNQKSKKRNLFKTYILHQDHFHNY